MGIQQVLFATAIPNIVDFTVTPSVSGVSDWSISADGALILDGSNSQTYTLVAQRSFTLTVKMWGQGSSGATGGYTTGSYSFTKGNTYAVKLNTGAGGGGLSFGNTSSSPGGGYAGLFNGSTVSQATALMIAGGAGGCGNNVTTCTISGGGGGGPSGGNGSPNPNSEVSAQGGTAGSQSSAGSGGSGSGYNVIWGSPNSAPMSPSYGGVAAGALQGGSGGIGIYPGPPVTHVNAPGGAGGGGGYFGGGGGAGGNDFGNGTRAGGSGGGGSGYVHTSVISGSTSTFANGPDPNRGTAGQVGGPARVVIE